MWLFIQSTVPGIVFCVGTTF